MRDGALDAVAIVAVLSLLVALSGVGGYALARACSARPKPAPPRRWVELRTRHRAATAVELATWMSAHIERGRADDVLLAHIDGLPDELDAVLTDRVQIVVTGFDWATDPGDGHAIVDLRAIALDDYFRHYDGHIGGEEDPAPSEPAEARQ